MIVDYLIKQNEQTKYSIMNTAITLPSYFGITIYLECAVQNEGVVGP